MNFFFFFFFWGLGNSSKGPEKDYSIKGDTESQIFGIFNAIAIIATTYGNGIIPEIQVCKIFHFSPSTLHFQLRVIWED